MRLRSAVTAIAIAAAAVATPGLAAAATSPHDLPSWCTYDGTGDWEACLGQAADGTYYARGVGPGNRTLYVSLYDANGNTLATATGVGIVDTNTHPGGARGCLTNGPGGTAWLCGTYLD